MSLVESTLLRICLLARVYNIMKQSSRCRAIAVLANILGAVVVVAIVTGSNCVGGTSDIDKKQAQTYAALK